MKKYVIGLDYGTDSVRCLIADATNGQEVASSVFEYPRWKEGRYCNAFSYQYRQHPLDYLEGLEQSIKAAISQVPHLVEDIAAISVDTTSSTIAAVDHEGVPLALLPGFEENPNAMFLLWKDHTAISEADEINHLCHTWGGTDYTKYSGLNYSSEWFWAKILHVVRSDEKVARSAISWVEHCDWIPALLTGCRDHTSIIRSRCAAGHKALWHREWGGLPPAGFLSRLDARLEKYSTMYTSTYTCDHIAGNLSAEWAQRLGLSTSVAVGAGSVDAHMGAVGGEIQPRYLTKVMGTSTCDMVVCSGEEVGDQLIEGICGQVDGSIIPGMVGMEAGQSAFGDIYAWFRNLLMWPLNHIMPDLLKGGAEHLPHQIIRHLSEQAQLLPEEETGLVAVDWFNGRRTPGNNQNLKGGITGLTLGTDAPRIFKSLVEATAFGSRRINDCYTSQGVPVEGITALGGVAKKSPFVVQTLCNVLNMPIRVVRSEQACALGAAMAASVVAGIHPSVRSAQKAMGQGFEKTYHPDPVKAKKYDQSYQYYLNLCSFTESQNPQLKSNQ